MRTYQTSIITVALIVVLNICVFGSDQATAAIQLTDLLVDGATLPVGDNLIFDEFTYSSTGQMPSSDGLVVSPFQDAFGNYGIRLVGGMSDSAGGDASTIDLGYRVTATDGMGIMSAGISAATLAGNPVAVGQGSFTITEAFAQIPTTLTIFDEALGATKLLDSMNLPSVLSSLNVDLSVVGDAIQGGATASFIDQTFAVQTDGVVPEPASFFIWAGTLLVFGVIPLGYRRWWSGREPRQG